MRLFSTNIYEIKAPTLRAHSSANFTVSPLKDMDQHFITKSAMICRDYNYNM